MKRVISLMLLVCSIGFLVDAQEPVRPKVTMTTKKAIGQTISFNIQSKSAIAIEVDYGDGVLVRHQLDRTIVKVEGTVKGPNIGIYGPSITYLACNSNSLTALDVSKSTELVQLNCSFNELTALDVSNNTALKFFDCNQNKLTALDVSNHTWLESINCAQNQLSTLNISGNTSLTHLYCFSNKLTTLNASSNTALKLLECHTNLLTALNVSNSTALTKLQCYKNQLTALDLSGNALLNVLSCGNNKLTTLDVSNCTALTVLDCAFNELTTFDASSNTALQLFNGYQNKLTALNVSGCTLLEHLNCDTNQLTTLNVSGNLLLRLLICDNNQLTNLDLSVNTALKILYCTNNQLTVIDIPNNTTLAELTCENNQLSLATLPLAQSAGYYTYAPQADFKIAENISVGQPIDLSAQSTVDGNITSFVWFTRGGTTLIEGTDYEITNGITTFLQAQTDAVYCRMTNVSFPDFTRKGVLKTTLAKVSVVTTINDQTASSSIKIYSGDKSIVVQTEVEARITVFDIYGRALAAERANKGHHTIHGISKGIYLVKVESNGVPFVEKVVVQ